jgi:hypothetical protein
MQCYYLRISSKVFVEMFPWYNIIIVYRSEHSVACIM